MIVLGNGRAGQTWSFSGGRGTGQAHNNLAQSPDCSTGFLHVMRVSQGLIALEDRLATQSSVIVLHWRLGVGD